MNLKGWISWQIALVCAGCLSLGAGAAFVGSVYLLQADTAVLVSDLKRKTDRVQLLESLVIQQSRTVVARALDQGPEAPPPDVAAGAPAREVAAQTAAQTTATGVWASSCRSAEISKLVNSILLSVAGPTYCLSVVQLAPPSAETSTVTKSAASSRSFWR